MNKRSYRVLLVNLTKSFGGADVRVLTQARALQDYVDSCVVATLQGSALHKQLQDEGLPHQVISAGRGDPRSIWQLQQLIRKGDYQIVDAHNVQSILWGHYAAWLAGVPVRISTIHSDYGKEYPGVKGQLYEGVLRITRGLTSRYINVTEVLQQKSVDTGHADTSTLIPNAVPIPAELCQSKDTSLYHEWGFAPEDYVVGIVARLNLVKGHQYLIKAMAQLEDMPQVKLLIVGTGPLETTLQEQVTSLGLSKRVHFTGFRQDIPRIMQSIDCMCVASLSEALPYVVLEAASYARPVLATSVGGLVSLLEDQKTAVMVESMSATSLEDGIRWLASHPEEVRQIGLSGYAMIKRLFSVESMIEAILQVYDGALL
jgi:glycosyltransferase involved in cell wall biosynthesis